MGKTIIQFLILIMLAAIFSLLMEIEKNQKQLIDLMEEQHFLDNANCWINE